ncbi:MAG: copper resistance protein CopC, partial [Gemmatimonadetes bacterium]|nr:copper resistance protein CopC [Gemmatimonadota bacterium]
RRVVVGAALIGAALVTLTASARAAMHLRLTKSEPAKDAVVAAPSQLQLWFSLKPAMSVTAVKLTSASDVAIKLGKPTHAGDVKLPVVVSVDEPLAPGKYTVSYKTASSDMHPITGDYSFTVK